MRGSLNDNQTRKAYAFPLKQRIHAHPVLEGHGRRRAGTRSDIEETGRLLGLLVLKVQVGYRQKKGERVFGIGNTMR